MKTTRAFLLYAAFHLTTITAIALPGGILLERDGGMIASAIVGPLDADQPGDSAALDARSIHSNQTDLDERSLHSKRQLSFRKINHCPQDAPRCPAPWNSFSGSSCTGTTSTSYSINCHSPLVGNHLDGTSTWDGACTSTEICVDGIKQPDGLGVAWCVQQTDFILLAKGANKPFYWRHVNPPAGFQPGASNMELLLVNAAGDELYESPLLQTFAQDGDFKIVGGTGRQCKGCSRLQFPAYPVGTETFGVHITPAAGGDTIHMYAYFVTS